MICRFATPQAGAPQATLAPDRRLDPLLAHGYECLDAGPTPLGGGVIPAGVQTSLVVDVEPSTHRSTAVVHGPNGSPTIAAGHAADPAASIETCVEPLGAYILFGPAVSDAGDSTLSLEELVGTDARLLCDRIQHAATWVERARLLDAFLLDRRARGPEPSPEVAEAWRLLVVSGGARTISGIAREVGWSHKHLITKFRQQVGVAPRLAARLLRLERVWRRIESGRSWARIAAESGYADQSHLVREFREFTGTTPGALAA